MGKGSDEDDTKYEDDDRDGVYHLDIVSSISCITKP